MKLILVNGPPRAGKDTLAKYLYNKYSASLDPNEAIHFERFSQPLKATFAVLAAKPMNHFFEVEYYEDHKDEVIPWLGASFRSYQIALSEDHFKPAYGEDIFGRLFINRLREYRQQNNFDGVVVVPDSGFKIEIDVLEQEFRREDVLLCRIHRPGYDFSGDSRSYVKSDKVFKP